MFINDRREETYLHFILERIDDYVTTLYLIKRRQGYERNDT